MNSFPSDFHDRNVCILGLGYVGLTLATVMAEIGFIVTGVEIRDDVLQLLKKGEAPRLYISISRAEGSLTIISVGCKL